MLEDALVPTAAWSKTGNMPVAAHRDTLSSATIPTTCVAVSLRSDAPSALTRRGPAGWPLHRGVHGSARPSFRGRVLLLLLRGSGRPEAPVPAVGVESRVPIIAQGPLVSLVARRIFHALDADSGQPLPPYTPLTLSGATRTLLQSCAQMHPAMCARAFSSTW